MGTFERALVIAAEAHAGQVDKGGQPYILHVLRVTLKQTSAGALIAAALHDVVEDTHWTLEALRAEGFSDEIVSAVDALTRRDRETYEDFIRRALKNPIARIVKIADLEDNMDLSRIPHPSAKDHARIAKYRAAHLALRSREST